MNTKIKWFLVIGLLSGGLAAVAAKPSSKQPGSPSHNETQDAGINVTTVNGQTTVTYKGRVVFKGQTTGPVRACANNDNGQEYAAAFAGEKVIWENTPGAGQQVASICGTNTVSATTSDGNDMIHRFMEQHGMPDGSDSSSTNSPIATGISVSTVSGQTTVTYKGQVVFKGPTTGPVRGYANNDNGQEYAAAFAGEKVIWENTPGAAKHVSPTGKKSTSKMKVY